MFDFGIEQQFLDQNPCGRLRKPVPTRVRERVLSFEEIRRLWFSIEDRHALTAEILRIQMLTGQRIGEVMSMRWQDVDFQAGWWTIPAERAKNNRHRVPLSEFATELLGHRRP